MKKEVKTNVMRILEKEKVDYEAHYYPHGKEAVDGVTVAETLPDKILIMFLKRL